MEKKDVELSKVFNLEVDLLKEHAENLEKELKQVKELINELELLRETNINFKDEQIRPIASLRIMNLLEEQERN